MLRFFFVLEKGGDLLVYFVDYVRTKCDDGDDDDDEIIDADAMIIIASFFARGKRH